MLNELIKVKEDIKSAIIENKVEPAGGLITYADAIREITRNGAYDINFFISQKAKFGYSFSEAFPNLATSHYTNMDYMFENCSKLKSISGLNTSNVTSMIGTFSGCTSLTYVPQLDTSNVTVMKNTFRNCTSLTEIPNIDTSNVVNMDEMFYGCGQKDYLNIPLLDCGNVKSMDNMFFNVLYPKLAGLKDLGKKPELIRCNLGNVRSLESILNVIDTIYDRKSAGYDTADLLINDDYKSTLSDSYITTATNKGWIIKFIYP